jgi:hypothetical protein
MAMRVEKFGATSGKSFASVSDALHPDFGMRRYTFRYPREFGVNYALILLIADSVLLAGNTRLIGSDPSKSHGSPA